MMSLDTIESPVPSNVTLKSCAETDCEKTSSRPATTGHVFGNRKLYFSIGTVEGEFVRFTVNQVMFRLPLE